MSEAASASASIAKVSARNSIGRPERAASVERVKHHVAAPFVIELGYKFAVRVDYDCALSAVADLRKDVSDQGRFASAGRTSDEDVLGFFVFGNDAAAEPDPAVMRTVRPIDDLANCAVNPG
jgi:hypothetical protein